mmetsp:Transcript_10307/g.23552  ORF Transcript_10307/g.23552 Transcript_10307/m.23552 type:complete len:295 (-) Transcript_10307:1712-2596(-)
MVEPWTTGPGCSIQVLVTSSKKRTWRSCWFPSDISGGGVKVKLRVTGVRKRILCGESSKMGEQRLPVVVRSSAGTLSTAKASSWIVCWEGSALGGMTIHSWSRRETFPPAEDTTAEEAWIGLREVWHLEPKRRGRQEQTPSSPSHPDCEQVRTPPVNLMNSLSHRKRHFSPISFLSLWQFAGMYEPIACWASAGQEAGRCWHLSPTRGEGQEHVKPLRAPVLRQVPPLEQGLGRQGWQKKPAMTRRSLLMFSQSNLSGQTSASTSVQFFGFCPTPSPSNPGVRANKEEQFLPYE